MGLFFVSKVLLTDSVLFFQCFNTTASFDFDFAIQVGNSHVPLGLFLRLLCHFIGNHKTVGELDFVFCFFYFLQYLEINLPNLRLTFFKSARISISRVLSFLIMVDTRPHLSHPCRLRFTILEC